MQATSGHEHMHGEEKMHSSGRKIELWVPQSEQELIDRAQNLIREARVSNESDRRQEVLTRCIDESGEGLSGTEVVGQPSGSFMTDIALHGLKLEDVKRQVDEHGINEISWHPGCGAAALTLAKLKDPSSGAYGNAFRSGLFDQVHNDDGSHHSTELEHIVAATDVDDFSQRWTAVVAKKLGVKFRMMPIERLKGHGHGEAHYGTWAVYVEGDDIRLAEGFERQGCYVIHSGANAKIDMWNAALAQVVARGGHSAFKDNPAPFMVAVVTRDASKLESLQKEATAAWKSLAGTEEGAPKLVAVNPDNAR